ncbi:MAG: EamA family transporter [Kibdelosporangium sp.]
MTTDTFTPVSQRARGTALLLTASVFFSSSGPIAKPAMAAGLTPQQVASVRIGLAAVILLVALAVFKPSLLRVRVQDWRMLAGYGLFGVAGAQFCYFASVSRLPVGIAMLLEFTAPLLVALWVRFARKTMLPRQAWIGTGVAFAGLAMIAQVWEGLRLDAIGVLAGVGAAVCAACYFLIGERALTTRHPLTVTTWGMVVGAIALIALAPPWTLPAEILVRPTPLGPVWTQLIAVSLLSTVLAYIFGMSGMRHLPSNVASVLALAEPVVATALAYFLLGEQLTVVQIIGGIVLLGGAFWVQRASQPPAGEAIHLPMDPSGQLPGPSLAKRD